MNKIETIFQRMDDWRHLPDYRLERRADLFFSLYLPAVLEAGLGYPVLAQMLPEFPVRIGTIYPDVPTHKSYKVDYLALSALPPRPGRPIPGRGRNARARPRQLRPAITQRIEVKERKNTREQTLISSRHKAHRDTTGDSGCTGRSFGLRRYGDGAGNPRVPWASVFVNPGRHTDCPAP